MSGVIATMATMPNASVSTDSAPLTVTQAPTASGRMNVEVSGPEATPPEAKAIAVYIPGTKNERPSEMK